MIYVRHIIYQPSNGKTDISGYIANYIKQHYLYSLAILYHVSLTRITSDLGVFPLLLPADSFSLPAEGALGSEGTVCVVAGSPSVLISVL